MMHDMRQETLHRVTCRIHLINRIIRFKQKSAAATGRSKRYAGAVNGNFRIAIRMRY